MVSDITIWPMQDTLLERAAQSQLALAQATALCERLRDERRRDVQAAYAAGLSMRAIGKVLGLSAPRVQRVIKGNRPQVSPPPVDL